MGSGRSLVPNLGRPRRRGIAHRGAARLGRGSSPRRSGRGGSGRPRWRAAAAARAGSWGTCARARTRWAARRFLCRVRRPKRRRSISARRRRGALAIAGQKRAMFCPAQRLVAPALVGVGRAASLQRVAQSTDEGRAQSSVSHPECRRRRRRCPPARAAPAPPRAPAATAPWPGALAREVLPQRPGCGGWAPALGRSGPGKPPSNRWQGAARRTVLVVRTCVGPSAPEFLWPQKSPGMPTGKFCARGRRRGNSVASPGQKFFFGMPPFCHPVATFGVPVGRNFRPFHADVRWGGPGR